jgi:hypothetical protein
MKTTTSIGAAAALLAGAVSAQSFRRLGACPTLGTTIDPGFLKQLLIKFQDAFSLLISEDHT